MICKNCSAEYDDKLDACPVCSAEDSAKEAQAEELAAEESADAETGLKETEEKSAEAPAETEKKGEEKNPMADMKVNASMMPAGKVKRTPDLRATNQLRKERLEEQKRHKKASAFIIVIMCFVACLTVAAAVLNLTTDIFKEEGASEKVVAGIAFTPQEEKELELLLAKSFSATRNEFSKTGVTAESFLSKINPADSGNIYLMLNGVSESVQTTADPANRFADENGAYAYYKLPEDKVDNVLSLFGIESYRGENSRNYYYCNGYYYFAAVEAKATPVVSVEIVKSRRVLDGSYYVEGYFYAEKNGETVKTDNYHFVIQMSRNTSGNIYTVERVSKEPIFGSDGKLVADAESAEHKKEVIEGYTEDGKLFFVYTLEFPVVEGSSEGYTNLNEFFSNAVSVYKLKAEAAQQSYADFRKSGGDDSKLPLAENLVASVVYEDDKNLSFKVEISRYTAEGTNGVYERSVEAYTFDKASGNFVSKDSALGKNYMLISEILYRIYNGYEYESLLPEENEEGETDSYDEVPADADGIGTRIYESSWAYTDDGITFWYITDKGYAAEVTIPAAAVKKLK